MILYLQLFLCFLKVGCLSIGGGYAAMPIIQSQVVDHYHWITLSEFTDLITIAEMTPGPIAVNAATFVGIRVCKIPGALLATFACILPACLIVTVLAVLYTKYRSMRAVQTILGMLRPVVVALIASAGTSILLNVIRNETTRSMTCIDFPALILFVGAFLLIRLRKKHPIPVMIGCGILYLAFHLVLQKAG